MPWRLFEGFVLRHLWRSKGRALTTVAGVSLGIAVVIAMQLTKDAAMRGFDTAVESIAGRTSIEIVAGGLGIDETLLPQLLWLREYGDISPVIDGELAVLPGAGTVQSHPGRPAIVRVLGVDLLRDMTVRDYSLQHGAPTSRQGAGTPPATGPGNAPMMAGAMKLLSGGRTMMVTRQVAEFAGVSEGGTLRVAAGDRVLDFEVAGILEGEGPAQVMGGSFGVMDISAAQDAFDRLGRIDRLDVVLNPGRSVETDLPAIARRLPAGLAAQRPAQRGAQVEKMLASFNMNVTAMSGIALMVGLFLIYNTISVSVIARRTEIGVLRALGVSRGQVMALFLGEAAALASVGAFLGLVLARLMADGALALTSSTVNNMYVAAAAAPPALQAWHVGLAVGLAVPLALLAAAVPAVEASRVPPTAAIAGHAQVDARFRLAPSKVWLPIVCLLAAAGLALLGPINGIPVFGYLSAAVTVLGTSLLVPAILFGTATLTRTLLRRLGGVSGLLAHANLASAIPRLSISVAALAVSLSMMVSIAIMVGSFRETVRVWVTESFQADVFVSPAMPQRPGVTATLSDEMVTMIAALPGVQALDPHRIVELVYNGNLIAVSASDLRVEVEHGSLMFKSPADGGDAVRQAVGHDVVLVSEPFSTHYGIGTGDSVTLTTDHGPARFVVAGVFYNYSNDRGLVSMDRTTFSRHFGDARPTGIGVYLEPGFSPDAVRRAMLDAAGSTHRISVMTNASLRREVLRVFDSVFAVTYALEVIAVFVAMMGVAGTLLTLVLERTRELSLLRMIGASQSQVRRVVVLEAVLIGAASQGLGLVVGAALSLVLIYVINFQSFGWTIQFSVPTTFLVRSSIGVLVATGVAGFLPARQAAKAVMEKEE